MTRAGRSLGCVFLMALGALILLAYAGRRLKHMVKEKEESPFEATGPSMAPAPWASRDPMATGPSGPSGATGIVLDEGQRPPPSESDGKKKIPKGAVW